MKYIILLCYLLLLQISSKAQDLLYAYKDTINDFSISMPAKWRYWTEADFPELKLRAYNMDSSLIGRFQDNFNIIIQNTQPADIESSHYELLNYIAKEHLQLSDTGTYIVNGEKVRWFDEMRISKTNKDTLCNSIFTIYSNKKTYIITCTSSRERFPEARKLFHQVAQTFNSKLPPAYESLNILFPEIASWTMIFQTHDSTMHGTIIVPPSETAKKWTSSVTNISYRGQSKESIEETVERFAVMAKSKSKDAELTLLSKDQDRALFKIESNQSKPEANLYYIIQGNSAFHTVFFTLKQAKLPAEVIEKWSDIFREAKFVVGR